MRKSLFLNIFYHYIFIWLLATGLYDVRLSKILHPSLSINFVILSAVLLYFCLFIVFYRKSYIKISIQHIREMIIKKCRLYKKLTLILFVIGSCGSILEIILYFDQLPILLQDKINAGTKNHYIHYISHFAVYSSVLASFIYAFTREKKYLMIIFLTSIEIGVWLKRGELLPVLWSIVVGYYLFSLYYGRTKKFLLILLGSVTIFFFIFSAFGNLRQEYVLQYILKMSLNELYELPSWFPSSFTWVYIYITSPLENFRHILFEQNISFNDYRWGLLLIYPFIAPLYKALFNQRFSYYPYLDNNYGLNVSTFMADAVNDFGIFGIYIYSSVYFIVSYLSIKFLKRGILGAAAFVYGEMFAMWSIFSNSIANGVFMIGFLLFITLSLFSEKEVVYNHEISINSST